MDGASRSPPAAIGKQIGARGITPTMVCGAAVESDRLAQDVGPRAEPALPKAVAEQGHVGAARAILVGGEPAAEDGLQAEQGEDSREPPAGRGSAPARPRP